MKKIVFLLFIVCASMSHALAQEWTTNIDDAKKLASQENKSIILVFKGSDWCAPCMKLDQNIFTSEEFISNYKSNFVLLKADFPKKKKNALSEEQQKLNNNLASVYNPNGHFPLVVVLDANGNVLGETGYNKLSPSEYLDSLIAFTK